MECGCREKGQFPSTAVHIPRWWYSVFEALGHGHRSELLGEPEAMGRSCQYSSTSLTLFLPQVLLDLLGFKIRFFKIFHCNFSWGSVLYNFLKRGQCDGMERVLFWELHKDIACLLLLFTPSLVRSCSVIYPTSYTLQILFVLLPYPDSDYQNRPTFLFLCSSKLPLYAGPPACLPRPALSVRLHLGCGCLHNILEVTCLLRILPHTGFRIMLFF